MSYALPALATLKIMKDLEQGHISLLQGGKWNPLAFFIYILSTFIRLYDIPGWSKLLAT